jgi:acyl carrier protein
LEKLLAILKSLHPRVDFAAEPALVDDGILDSFDIITLVTELSDTFGVEIDLEYLEPENFNSVDAMAALLTRLGARL